MNTRKLILSAATLAIVTVLLTLNFKNVYSPPSIPGSKDHLSKAEVIQLKGAVGPKSIAFDPNGDGPYTGVADGRILKWLGDSQGWIDFAVTSSHRQQVAGVVVEAAKLVQTPHYKL